MGRTKKTAPTLEELMKRYEITPEEREAMRAEMERQRQKAIASGAYEKLLALRGKVKWDLDLEQLRKDRE